MDLLSRIDLAVLAILAASVAIGAARGALRTISGLAGTLLGALGAFKLQAALAPIASRLLTPLVRGMVLETARSSGLESVLDSPLSAETIELFGRLTGALGFSPQAGAALEAQALAAGARVADALTSGIVAQLAPASSFVALFLVIKLCVGLLMRLPMWNRMPVIGTANRILGAGLGLLSGVVVVAALCAGLLLFAPEHGDGPLIRDALAASVTGSLVARAAGLGP